MRGHARARQRRNLRKLNYEVIYFSMGGRALMDISPGTSLYALDMQIRARSRRAERPNRTRALR